MKRLFSNKFSLIVIALLLNSSLVYADCRPGVFSLPKLKEVQVKEVSVILHDKTGCNYIFQSSLQDKRVSYPAGLYEPVLLMGQIAKRLNSQLSVTRTVMVIAESKVPLTGTGKLVSLNLVEAPVVSINQILEKLGSRRKIGGSKEAKLTIDLYDVPLDDVVTLLELSWPINSRPKADDTNTVTKSVQ